MSARTARTPAWPGGWLSPLLVVAALTATVSCWREPVASTPPGAERRPQFDGSRPLEIAVEKMTGTPDETIYPPIGYPKYIAASAADAFLDDDDAVFFLRSGRTTYVYPEIFLVLHHVVNDTIAGQPVLITQCFQSDSAILYSRVVGGQESLFGALGTAYHDNLVMYDFDTDSYWLQLRGEAFHGQRRGQRLEPLQALERTTWERIKRSGEIKVLPPEIPVSKYRRVHETITNFAAGREAAATVASDDELPPMSRGLGIVVHGQARFYALDTVRGREPIHDEIGGWTLLLVGDTATGPTRIFRRYIDGRVLSFERRGSDLEDRETRSTWSADGRCLSGELSGKKLEKPAYTHVYWYVWSALHPLTDRYGVAGEE